MSDIVDSTSLGNKLGDEAASALWAHHDRVTRDLLRKWKGQEIDKSDGFLITFIDVNDALEYANEYHVQLASLTTPVLARVAIHLGPIVVRSNEPQDVEVGAKPVELDGNSKSIAARVMSLAPGGRTLITSAVARRLKTTFTVSHHGYWRVKGLTDPVEIFEGTLGAPHPQAPLSDTPKAYRVTKRDNDWFPCSAIPNNLPAERDAFFGRQSELAQLAACFERKDRLAVVVGAGGTGKTRMAKRFGWKWLAEFPGGVWFCDLSQASSLDGLLHAVAQGLNIQLGGEDPPKQVASAIAGRGTCLIVFDNFEQLAGLAEQSLGVWLDHSPAASFLVTSREVLGLPGETVIFLDALGAADARALFQARSASAGAGAYHLDSEGQQHIGRLISLLDGLPLALELAAARTRSMSTDQLLNGMQERFDLLASSRGRQGRHATLRATLDWSWQLLSNAEQFALAQMSNFAGGFTASACSAIIDLPAEYGSSKTRELLQSLVDKSLVRLVDRARFGMLLSVRDYAAQRLGETGSLRLSRIKYASHYANMDERVATADRCIELDNLIAACRIASKELEPSLATKALANAWAALKLVGPFGAAADLAAEVAKIEALTSSQHAFCNWVQGNALASMGRGAQARRLFEEGLELARSAQDVLRESELLCSLGELLCYSDNASSGLELLKSALGAAMSAGDRLASYRAENALGSVAREQSRHESARDHYTRALALARDLHNQRLEGGVIGNLGVVAQGEGLRAEARQLYVKAIGLVTASGDKRWEGNMRCNLGLLAFEEGDFAAAHVELQLAEAIASQTGNLRLEGVVVCNLALLEQAKEGTRSAIQLFQHALAIARELDDKRQQGQTLGHIATAHAKEGELGLARQSSSEAELLLSEISDEAGLALLLAQRACFEAQIGDRLVANALLERTHLLLAILGRNVAEETRAAIELATNLVAN